jgi:hypothetical protein
MAMETSPPQSPARTPGRAARPRLFIKEMVLRNFKSYAGEQRIGPFHKVSHSHSHIMFCFRFRNPRSKVCITVINFTSTCAYGDLIYLCPMLWLRFAVVLRFQFMSLFAKEIVIW